MRVPIPSHKSLYIRLRWDGTMSLMNVLCDVKVWILIGIVMAMAMGFDHPDAATILMVVLIAQMSVSLDGIRFIREDLARYRRNILWCIIGCFGINTGLTLLTGLFFIDDPQLWTGWVMLASVPCAVSVVVSSLIMRGDAKLSVLGLTVIYVVAIAFTPVLTKLILGNAVNPFEIMRYIVMFIVIPFALSFVIRRLQLRREPKTVFINLMMLLMVFIGLGSRRDYILSDLETVFLLIIACSIRITLATIIILGFIRRGGIDRENGIVYMVMSVWKNSGMSISLTMALFASTMPAAVLPCIVSLVIETAWFAIMTKYVDKVIPEPDSDYRFGIVTE